MSIKFKYFFDRQVVIDAVDKASRKNLSKAGGTLRRVAVNSIKPRAFGVSAPAGQPPFDHVGYVNSKANRALRKLGQAAKSLKGFARGLRYILYSYEPSTKGVVVGPGLGDGKPYPGGTTVPELEEFGGTVRKRSGKTVTVAPHPYMGPALQKTKSTYPSLWAGSVRS